MKSSEILLVGDIDYKDESLKLDHTAAEITAIDGVIKEINGTSSAPFEVVSLKGKAPTKNKVRQELPKAKIAHLATHGFFAESDPASTGTRGGTRALVRASTTAIGTLAAARNPLVASGFLLAPETETSENPQESKTSKRSEVSKKLVPASAASISTDSGTIAVADEGKLTAEELIDLDLRNCDLVVLSACDTGRGKEERGQGVLGLRSAFMSAGVKSLVLSLWPVDDDATRFLMTEFYKQILINKKPRAKALKLAQQAVRDNKDNPDWKHPFFWAAWVLVGQGW